MNGGASKLNTSTPEGVALFQSHARQWVNASLAYCQDYLGVPGPARCAAVLFWNLEGSQYNWITYTGDPTMLPELAPEMDAIADELLGSVTAAGLRVGVTLRPQQVTPSPCWNPSMPPSSAACQKWYQQDLYRPDNTTDVEATAALLVRKARYAISRWNASVFYVDSTANKNGPLPFLVWDRVTAQLPPHILFFPEQHDPLEWANTAPLQDNWGGEPIDVDPVQRAIWPGAWNLRSFAAGGGLRDVIPKKQLTHPPHSRYPSCARCRARAV